MIPTFPDIRACPAINTASTGKAFSSFRRIIGGKWIKNVAEFVAVVSGPPLNGDFPPYTPDNKMARSGYHHAGREDDPKLIFPFRDWKCKILWMD